MPQVVPFIPLIAGGLGLAGGVLGGQEEVSPQPTPPMFPGVHDAMARWLSNQFDSSGGEPVPYGIAPFPGQLSPNINNTRLPEVAANWAPWNAGNSAMASWLANPGIGQQDPRLAQMQQWGGTGGPGHNAMSLAMQFGSPSQAGQYVANTAQFGVNNQAMGNLMNRFLNPQGPAYAAPPIPSRQVTRRA